MIVQKNGKKMNRTCSIKSKKVPPSTFRTRRNVLDDLTVIDSTILYGGVSDVLSTNGAMVVLAWGTGSEQCDFVILLNHTGVYYAHEINSGSGIEEA